jgi:two-component system chemotaxis response regulator CheB
MTEKLSHFGGECMGYSIVVVGTSFGGLKALTTLARGLPRDFPLPVVVVQHRSKDADDTLSTLLGGECRLRVQDAEDKNPVLPGCVYLAPPDYHLLIDDGEFTLSCACEAPVFYSRPSIDALFVSAAECYGAGVIGVVLTGANSDGSFGLRRIKDSGGYAIVQDPNSAEGPAMPRAAIKEVAVDKVLSIEQVAPALVELSLDQ